MPLGLASIFTVDSGSHLVAMQYSREQELEADQVALQIMMRSGYDPKGAITFHQKLLSDTDSFLPILSTHPPGKERIVKIHATLKNL